MSDTATIETTDQILEELHEWLSAQWDPDLTVGEWWERLGLAGWSAPSLPEHAYGRKVPHNDAVQIAKAISQFGALGAPAGLGLLLAAPTIAAHGTQAQVDRYVRDIVTGRTSWCQLFSEPSAGSDLAGLQSRAVRDGDEWIVNGQKVWTSAGQRADMGMLLARTNPDVPKHQGITYFALEMAQVGVEVRPLREMTGRSLFNEVFLTDARASDDAIIGGLDQGWAVANTTLANERAGLGSGGGSGAGGIAYPGSIGGHLDRRAGDFVEPGRAAADRAVDGNADRPRGVGPKRKRMGPKRQSGKASPADDPTTVDGGEGVMLQAMRGGAGVLIELAKRNGKHADAGVRQDLARLYTWSELGRFNGLRLKAAKQRGSDIPGMPNISKLSMSHIMRLSRDLGLRIAGAAGMLHAYDAAGRQTIAHATSNASLVSVVTELSLLAQAPPIYGGTDQVQRNIIGERVLGLPKEPGSDRTTPFSELPKNA